MTCSATPSGSASGGWRCSPGGCTLEAAEAVLPGRPALPAEAVFETVTALVDRSLLTTEERCGSMRYGMLESVHQFARKQLAQAGEQEELSRRHLAWLIGYARPGRPGRPRPGGLAGPAGGRPGEHPGRPGVGPGPARRRRQALALAGLLAPFWMVRGHAGLGRRWLDSALAAAGPGGRPAAAGDRAGRGRAAGLRPVRPRGPARLPGGEPGHLARPRATTPAPPAAWATSARPRTSAASTRPPWPCTPRRWTWPAGRARRT